MLCTNTSAVATRSSRASRASCRFRFSVTLRLLRLMFMCIAAMFGCRAGPVWRLGSPCGVSTLITSAPRSPRIMVASGPRILTVRSMTRTPASGPAAQMSVVV